MKRFISMCLKDFELLGINYKISAEKEFEENLRIEARFEGPLYLGNPRSANILRMDFNKEKVKNKEANVIRKLFSDVPLFALLVLSEKEILAEKIRALVNRSEPRDLYDVWMPYGKGVEIDNKLFSGKLKEKKSDISKLNFPSKESYERDLKNLVNILPPYEQIKKEVYERLSKIEL